MDDLIKHAESAGPLGERWGLAWLIGAAIATIVLWQLPFGNWILWPFTILATWFHEMGHGLTAWALGGKFDHVAFFMDGSGYAAYVPPEWCGRFGKALIAAGGPLGPPIAGAAFILCSRNYDFSHYGLLILGGALLLSTILWVRGVFGVVMVPIIGGLVLLLAKEGSAAVQVFAVQFFGVQACLSTFNQLNYLFSKQAVVNGRVNLSDSSQIAEALLLPYWFWGLAMMLASLSVLVLSLRHAYRI